MTEDHKGEWGGGDLSCVLIDPLKAPKLNILMNVFYTNQLCYASSALCWWRSALIRRQLLQNLRLR